MKKFRNKERETNLERQIERLCKKLTEKEEELNKAKEENRRLRSDLDYEHAENCEQHRKILQIERTVRKPAGTIKELVDIRIKIKELINTANID